MGDWAAASNVEIAYTPTNSSWLNRIEAPFTALRYFTLDGTDHASHKEQASMIRRYIIWRNNHAMTNGSAASSTGRTQPDPAAGQEPGGRSAYPSIGHTAPLTSSDPSRPGSRWYPARNAARCDATFSR